MPLAGTGQRQYRSRIPSSSERVSCLETGVGLSPDFIRKSVFFESHTLWRVALEVSTVQEFVPGNDRVLTRYEGENGTGGGAYNRRAHDGRPLASPVTWKVAFWIVKK